MDIKSILSNNNRLALIIGNGINRYSESDTKNSWDDILLQLWNKYIEEKLLTVPKGISLPEFFDILQLCYPSNVARDINLQFQFCKSLKNWKPDTQHMEIVHYARQNSMPILTTNFDNNLGSVINGQIFKLGNHGFTDYYPWDCYISDREINSTFSSFAIWHINGMQKYVRSIRLGLSHYMGSVQRARIRLHGGKEDSLFHGKNRESWRGVNTWLHLIFNNDLLIFGLGLGVDEVFLRWLLLERAKYYQLYPDRLRKAWFVYKTHSPGQALFLKSIGIQLIKVNEHGDIYENNWVEN